jgi:hypothetical protein
LFRNDDDGEKAYRTVFYSRHKLKIRAEGNAATKQKEGEATCRCTGWHWEEAEDIEASEGIAKCTKGGIIANRCNCCSGYDQFFACQHSFTTVITPIADGFLAIVYSASSADRLIDMAF